MRFITPAAQVQPATLPKQLGNKEKKKIERKREGTHNVYLSIHLEVGDGAPEIWSCRHEKCTHTHTTDQIVRFHISSNNYTYVYMHIHVCTYVCNY